MKYDVIIENVKVVDGTGKEAFEGSVAIIGDEIVAINPNDTYEVTKKIDGTGRYLVPGFVDVHTHVDLEFGEMMYGVLTDRYLENMVRQGVTSAVGGNCGYAITQVGDFFRKLALGNSGPNIGVQMGHGMLRMMTMGMENVPPTEEQMEQMKGMLKNALDEGALGLSSGLGYAPGNYADEKEIQSLCEVVKEYGGFYSSHIRNQDRQVRESWKELIEVGEATGVKLILSHCQVIGEECWGAAPQLVEMLHEARERGVDICADAFPYEGAGWSLVGVLIPNWVQANKSGQQIGINEEMIARLKDESLLPKIREEIEDLIGLRGKAEGILFLSAPTMPELGGKYLHEISEMWGLSPVESVIKIAIETPVVECTGFQCSFEDKQAFYGSPYCAVASDGSSTLLNRIKNTPTQPRQYGCFPHFLELYVKEKGLFTLEEAIRKMTSLPASMMGIRDRGVIAVGKKADLLLIDMETMKDNASYLDSNHFPSGIDMVMINGEFAVLDGVHQKILSGVALKLGKC